MAYIQLIEKISLPTQLWLTFWNLTDGIQMSMEIGMPSNEYEVGQVFWLDRNKRDETLALQLVVDPASLNLDIPLPVPSSRPAGGALGETAIKSRPARVVVQQPPGSPTLAPEIVTLYCK
jgi:hypothetical protein